MALTDRDKTFLKDTLGDPQVAQAVIDVLDAVAVAPVDSATVISRVDLVWLDTDDVKPASDFTWDTNLATTQAFFAAVFLGVAMESSEAGQTKPINVEVNSLLRHMRTVVSGTYNLGSPLGPAEGSSEKLSNTVLAAVLSDGLAIARAMEHKPSTTTMLKVSFAPAYSTGSSNTNSHIG